jgi:hypothetical protein
LEELIRRIALLERRQTRHRQLMLALLVVFGAAFISGQAGQPSESANVPQVIEARAFRVLDEDGRLRAEISNKTGLSLHDVEGNLGARLAATDSGEFSLLQLTSKGRTVVELFTHGDGATLTLQEPRSGSQQPVWDKTMEIAKRREAAGLPSTPFTAEEEAEAEAANRKRASLTLGVFNAGPSIFAS